MSYVDGQTNNHKNLNESSKYIIQMNHLDGNDK